MDRRSPARRNAQTEFLAQGVVGAEVAGRQAEPPPLRIGVGGGDSGPGQAPSRRPYVLAWVEAIPGRGRRRAGAELPPLTQDCRSRRDTTSTSLPVRSVREGAGGWDPPGPTRTTNGSGSARPTDPRQRLPPLRRSPGLNRKVRPSPTASDVRGRRRPSRRTRSLPVLPPAVASCAHLISIGTKG